MKFKIDENLPAEICADLHGLGHDAETVPDEGLSGSSDETLLKRVQHEERIFLTRAPERRIDLEGSALLRR